MLIPVANIITILQSLNLYYILYSLSINARSILLVCLSSSIIKPVLDFTKREIVNPFQLQSYYKIIKGCPRNPVKTPSLRIEKKMYQLALTCYFLSTIISTCKTFNRLTRFDKQLFDRRVATAIANSLPITKFLNANKDQFTIVILAYKYMPICKKIFAGFFENM